MATKQTKPKYKYKYKKKKTNKLNQRVVVNNYLAQAPKSQDSVMRTNFMAGNAIDVAFRNQRSDLEHILNKQGEMLRNANDNIRALQLNRLAPQIVAEAQTPKAQEIQTQTDQPIRIQRTWDDVKSIIGQRLAQSGVQASQKKQRKLIRDALAEYKRAGGDNNSVNEELIDEVVRNIQF